MVLDIEEATALPKIYLKITTSWSSVDIMQTSPLLYPKLGMSGRSTLAS
jgi:hypothetical protein